MYKQIIIARRDLDLSPGKLASQVSHGSMAFLTTMIRKNAELITYKRYNAIGIDRNKNKIPMDYRRGDLSNWAKEAFERGDKYFFAQPVNPADPYGKLELCDPDYHYESTLSFDLDLYEQWINGEFTKCVLEARNKNQLLKAKTMAEEMGMKEGEDFWCIRDNCRTELEPEETDENGVKRTLTCIGFRPFPSDIIDKIGKKYQLYK